MNTNIIKNKKDLAVSDLREKVLDIIEAGISRVKPSEIIQSAVSYDASRQIVTINGEGYEISRARIFVIGGGKASALMAHTLENILPLEKIEAGVVNCKNCDAVTKKIKLNEAGHPLPDERGVSGVQQMLALKNQYSISKNDLVICLISGGGSSLMPCPVEGISLADKQKLTKQLLRCGADIHEINAVRKHLSRIKGGGLGRYFAPAQVISLILSDVIGNDLDVIASGITCPDTSTFLSAFEVLRKYELLSNVPESIVEHLRLGCEGACPETPKSLTNCHNHLLGDIAMALKSMLAKAVYLGFNPCIVTAGQRGETTQVALKRAEEIILNEYAGYDCLLIGGETTPKLPANAGTGGRNQQFAAASLLALASYPPDWVLASVGTDGSDYLPDVAGAIIDNCTLKDAGKYDIKSFVDRYDSHTLLKKIGNSLIVTGDTGTNVGDIVIYAFKTI